MIRSSSCRQDKLWLLASLLILAFIVFMNSHYENTFPSLTSSVAGDFSCLVTHTSLLHTAFAKYGLPARQRLVNGLQKSDLGTRDTVFDDVVVSLPLPESMIRRGGSEGMKTMVKAELIFSNHNCTAYAAGVANDYTYELEVAKFCVVHAFDCTIDPPSDSENLHFHQVCLGQRSSIHKSQKYGGQRHQNVREDLIFMSLNTTMHKLGHTEGVSIMKFDVEGSEWDLFENEFFQADSFMKNRLPHQLQFELHTQWAKPEFVPSQIVEGKNKHKVNELFLRLFDLGYRVISKIISKGDPACAEFSLVRM